MDIAQTAVTTLLPAVAAGDPAAAERLWKLVYDELHRVAQRRLAREGRRGDLQTTVLVQEAYLRLIGNGNGGGADLLTNRRHFFAAAAKAMRQFLVDNARTRDRLKRGGGQSPGELDESAAVFEYDAAEVLALDEALEKLRQHDALAADIVQLRYFAGLTIDETAEVLGSSARLVDKKWLHARTWLRREMS